MTVKTLNTMEKLRLNGQLKKAIDARNAENSPLRKLPLIKAVQSLREQLGLVILAKPEPVAPVSENEPNSLHYSDRINQELMALGWVEANTGLAKTFNGAQAAGDLNPTGKLTVYARWNDNRRYLALEAGWATPFDMDGRDQDPKEFAQEFNSRAETFALGGSIPVANAPTPVSKLSEAVAALNAGYQSAIAHMQGAINAARGLMANPDAASASDNPLLKNMTPTEVAVHLLSEANNSWSSGEFTSAVRERYASEFEPGVLQDALEAQYPESVSAVIKVEDEISALLREIQADTTKAEPEPTPEPVAEPEPLPTLWDRDAIIAARKELRSIQQFIPTAQYSVMNDLLAGEEGEYFGQVISDLKKTIMAMPKVGSTDGQGLNAKARIHYFGGSFDAWVTELDPRTAEAFGAVSIGYEPELGYIHLSEYLDNPMVNIDFNWKPTALAKVYGHDVPDDGQEDEPAAEPSPALAKLTTKKDTSAFYEHAEKRTRGERQAANNAAIKLLKQFQNGERDSVTDADREVLAKYSGSGGNLTTADGKKGSAFEYYTPKPIAQGVWNILGELGFNGGKVLDPCAGVGIFGATSPESAVMDAIELDNVSGGVNQLVNAGIGHNVTVSTFEDVAANTPDETHDAVVGNVPFGDNAARGGNQFKDAKYQSDTLEAYFMLRSMDKLKPGGLAAFIVPPRVISGKGQKEQSLRQRLSLKGEMMGAYRLPNSVFGAAHADTITDIIVLRKHSRDVLAKVDELQATNPDALREANVLWSEFLDGHYFMGEGKRFVLGEFVAKDPAKFRDVDRVISDQSITNVAKLLRKFGTDSRINLELLDVAEPTATITYQNGDTVALNGQILTYADGKWEENRAATMDAKVEHLHGLMAKIGTPMDTLKAGVTWADFDATLQYMKNIGKSLDMPAWAAMVHRGLGGESKAADWFGGVVTGLAAKNVQVEHADDEEAENLVEAYPELAKAMKQHYKVKVLAGVDGDIRAAVKFIGIHYNGKTGFSGYWKGEREAKAVKLDTDAKLARTQYITGSLYFDVDSAKAIVEADGGVFDPMNDDDWMISADGKRVIKSDDYFVGNLGEALAKIDADIAAATDGAVKAKLLRMKEVAASRGNPLSVERMKFDMRSPMITPQEALAFFKAHVHADSALRQNDKNKRQYVDVDVKGSDLTLHSKLLNRVGDYMKNGTITIGGLDVSPLTQEEALKKLDEMVRGYNSLFNTWVKSNPVIMNRLETIAQNPNNVYFKQVDDRSEFEVAGISPEWKFHGYQRAFARRMSRRFSGINGFDVGLGKTATALMSIQHVQNIGVKRKTLILVPSSVLSNWRKEAVKGEGTKGQDGYKAPIYTSDDGCLFVGLTVGKDGAAKVNSKDYDRDLNLVLENRHSKVFMSFEAFKRIRLKDDTVNDYSDYLRTVDQSYSEALRVAKDEKNKSKLADLINVIRGQKSSTAAPFFEDMGFDSIVIDEAHAFKNSKETVEFEGGKFLSTAGASEMGLDAQAKVWYIRRETPQNDGVLALTATPITNSPLEIYSMLTLAVGEDRVNKMMLGATGADAFMNTVCSFQEQQEETVDGKTKSYRTFTGLKNVDALRQCLQEVAVIENAESVGSDFTIPEAPETATPVRLPADTEKLLRDYKVAYSVARAFELEQKTGNVANPGPTVEEMAIFSEVMDRTGEDQRLLAQPFNLINKMNNLIVDPDLDERATFYTTDNAELAEKICALYNKRKITDTRKRLGKYAKDADVKKTTVLKDAQGDVLGTEYTVNTKAFWDGNRIILDSTDFKAQMALEALIDEHALDVDMSIPPKFAALIANIQAEMANPRGIDGSRRTQKAVKQIVFCDSLSSHTKVKRLLVKHCGIPASKITFISGQYNNEPEALLDVQAGFNAGDDENVYQVIIGNKKAEVGINLQKGCQAIHHLTIGWTPDSLQQRNGRGVRQGNLTGFVSIYHYDADGTFDSYRRRLVNNKADWINNLLDKNGSDEVEVAGGLTKEQQEALIAMVGDEGAMATFQDTIEAQDRARRTAINRADQDTNIRAFIRSSNFMRKYEKLESYANTKANEFQAERELLEKAESTLAKSIDKGAKESTIKKNTAKVEELKASTLKILQDVAGSFDIHGDIEGKLGWGADKPVLDPEQAIEWIMGSNWSKYRTQFKFKGDEVDSIIKREWSNEMATNVTMNESANKELQNSLGKTGAYDADAIEAAKIGEAVRFKGAMVPAGGVAKRVEDGKLTYCLLEKRGREIEVRYFNQGYSNTYGTYRSSGADTVLRMYAELFVGIYSNKDPEYQEAIKAWAEIDNAYIKSKGGLLNPREQENLASFYVPEVAALHEIQVKQRFNYSDRQVVFSDNSVFPFPINPQYLDAIAGTNVSNVAKWQALIEKQADLYFEYDRYGNVETDNQDVFDDKPGEVSAVLLNALVKHDVKLSEMNQVEELARTYSGLYDGFVANTERGQRYLDKIQAAEDLLAANEAVSEWLNEVFGQYLVNIPNREEVIKRMPYSALNTQELKPMLEVLRKKELDLRVKSSDDYVYLTGNTRQAFKEIPFRDLAKECGSEIGWNPEGRKSAKHGDAVVIAKAKLAPSGVWVFQRMLWSAMQEQYPSEIVQFNLNIQEGN